MTSLPDNFGPFGKSVLKLWDCMNPCMLCPRKCKVYRSPRRFASPAASTCVERCRGKQKRSSGGEVGFCGIGDKPMVSSVGPHFGEESVLVGYGGSGTIFFAGCNLGCVFCQNFDISHHCSGRQMTIEKLAQSMLGLQNIGCSNINFVTPTHVIPSIAAALELARTVRPDSADGL